MLRTGGAHSIRTMPRAPYRSLALTGLEMEPPFSPDPRFSTPYLAFTHHIIAQHRACPKTTSFHQSPSPRILTER